MNKMRDEIDKLHIMNKIKTKSISETVNKNHGHLKAE